MDSPTLETIIAVYALIGVYAAGFAYTLWNGDPLAWLFFWPLLLIVRALRSLWNELRS